MAPPLGEQLRDRIVEWRYTHQKTAAEIADLAGCSERTVYTILRNHRDYLQTSNPFARPRGRPRILDQGDITYITSLLQANPTLYLDEIQERLLEARGVEPSLSTLSRVLQRLDITHKRVAKSALERDELVRATWQAEYGDIPAESFVWLDESSIDNRTAQRTEGWAPRGVACVRRATFIRGERFSLLPALSLDGIIALDIFEGSVNKDRFISFVRDQLVSIAPPIHLIGTCCSLVHPVQAPKLTPYPGPRSVVVMDNCAIHHDEEIREIVEGECGA